MVTKKKLAKLMIHTGEIEIQIEFARQNLCKAPAFEPYASFQRIDRVGKGYISPKDILLFVRENGLEDVQLMECNHIIKFFDSTMEGRLHYTDFLQIVLPCDQQYLRAQATQRQTYQVGDNEFLPYDIERLLSRLVYKELKLAKEQEALKQQLACRYDYSLDVLFKSVDDWNYKYIDQINLKRFLIKCGVLPDDNLLLAIIRRMDLDADAKLNLKEFIDSIRPIENFTTKRATGQPLYNPQKQSKRPRTAVTRSSNRPKKQSLQQQQQMQQQSQYEMSNFDQQDQNVYQTRDGFGSPSVGGTQTKSILKNSASKPSNNGKQGQGREEEKMDFNLSPQSQQMNSQFQQSSSLQYQIVDQSKNIWQNPNQPQPRSQTNGEQGLIVIVRDCFQEMLDLENGLEMHRKELSYQRDFTLMGAFQLFARSAQHKVNLDEFMFGLDRMPIQMLPSDVSLFFQRYDSDQDGKLGFWELSNALLPIDVRQRDELENRQQAFDLSYETKEIFKKVLKRCIDVEIQIEAIRKKVAIGLQLAAAGGVTSRQIFEQIDWLDRGFITKTDIKRAIDQLQEHVSEATSQMRSHPDSVEMEALVRRFNKDKQNGRISLPEWVEELAPKILETQMSPPHHPANQR